MLLEPSSYLFIQRANTTSSQKTKKITYRTVRYCCRQDLARLESAAQKNCDKLGQVKKARLAEWKIKLIGCNWGKKQGRAAKKRKEKQTLIDADLRVKLSGQHLMQSTLVALPIWMFH